MNIILKTLLEISIFASAIIIIAMLIHHLFSRKMSLIVMAVLWFMVLVRLLLPITIISPVHLVDVLPEKTAESMNLEAVSTHPLSTEITTIDPNAFPTDFNMEEMNSSTNNTSEYMQTPKPLSIWQKGVAIIDDIPVDKLLLMLWLLGAIMVFLLNIVRSYFFRRRLLRCPPVKDSILYNTLQGHCEKINIKRPVRMIACDFIEIPSVYGWMRPVILIPSHLFKRLDNRSKDCILLHELCHIRRNDILIKYLWLVAKALHWFNPLVWFAYGMVQENMELCCDRMVVKVLGKQGMIHYSQALLSLSKLITPINYPAIMATFCKKNSMLKGRIMRIVKPEKKSKLAVAISTTLALVIVIACFTTACQPTPENEVVVGKGKQQVEKMIEKAMDNENTSPNNTARLDYETPETLNYVLESELVGAKIKVDVDADVIIPEYTLPISTAVSKNITYPQVDKLLKLLMGNEKLYERMSTENLETKDTMQRAIDYYMKQINDLKDNPESQEYINEIKAAVKRLYNEMATAPDTFAEAKDIDGKLPEEIIISEDNYDKQKYDLAVGTSYIRANLSVQAQKSSKFQKVNYSVVGSYLPEALYYPELMTDFEMNIDEAIETAAPVVDILDPELVLSDISPAIVKDYAGKMNAFGYTLIYTRQFSGVNTNYAVDNNEWKYEKDGKDGASSGNVTYGNNGIFAEEVPNTEVYKEPYPQETLVITVGLEGIQAVSYTSPMQVNEVLAENVALMPFEDIQDIFNKHIILNGFDPSKEVYLDIDKVQLGLMRIDQQNSDEYLIVPVWDFYGNYVASRNNEHLENNPKPTKDYGRSFLTINAVDGSIIDRELGY